MTALLKLMRPRQWIKNLVVLAGPALGQKLDVASAIDTGLIFVAFCLASSAASFSRGFPSMQRRAVSYSSSRDITL